MLISYYANKKSSPRLPSWQPSLIFFKIPIESGSIIKPCTLKHFQVTYRLHKAGYWTNDVAQKKGRCHAITNFVKYIFNTLGCQFQWMKNIFFIMWIIIENNHFYDYSPTASTGSPAKVRPPVPQISTMQGQPLLIDLTHSILWSIAIDIFPYVVAVLTLLPIHTPSIYGRKM